MKIRILKTFKASIDGYNVVDFKIGEVLENDPRLTPHFLQWALDNKGFIEELKEEKMLPKIDNKAILNAPENKVNEIQKEELIEVKEVKITNKKNKR
jgi:hypothetical protein